MMTDNEKIQMAAGKIASFIYSMYIKELTAGNVKVACSKLSKKKLVKDKDVLFNYTD
jgi:hypothetical protein